MKRLSSDETAYFFEQLAMILNAGMQLSDGMDILFEDLSDKRIREICGQLSKSINSGKTLGDAMEECGKFPEYAVNMVKIGSVTGRLENVLKDLSEYYENRAELNRTVRSAVIHPLMLLLMMTAVIVVLIVLVLPMFSKIFAQFDASVSETVSSAVNTAYGIGWVILIVLLAVIVSVIIISLLSLIPSVRKRLSSFLTVFPLTKRISKKFSLAKISSAMSLMASAGIAAEEMPMYAASLINDKKLVNKLENCRERVLNGEYFADVISTSNIFPPMFAHSLKFSYTSGSFEQSWKKLSERCDYEAAEAASGIVSVIEPLIVIILTTVIGAVLLSVMIPLMNIMSVLG
ncbi:MAG: type II secretion system F family protein [Oscillospiraceae bacterium]|nr:type II secretion system F family protein [Oscillospiraceae bacterium]